MATQLQPPQPELVPQEKEESLDLQSVAEEAEIEYAAPQPRRSLLGMVKRYRKALVAAAVVERRPRSYDSIFSKDASQ